MTSAAELERIDRLAAQTALDVSPRGVTLRPDPDLEALLAGVGPGDVPAVTARLDAAQDPTAALVWGGALARLGTPDAEAALDHYAAGLHERDPWPDQMPGTREVLLGIGRATG